MKCPKCKQEIEDNSVFCEYCGEKIEKEQSCDTPEVEKDDFTTPQIKTGIWRKHKWMLPASITIGAIAVIFAIVWLVLPKNDTTIEENKTEEVHLYPICDEHGKWGYINDSREIIIAPQFEAVGFFSEGLASVLIGGKWGYISKNGTVEINPQYDVAGDFHDGLAPFSTNNSKWGYINREGRVVITPRSDMVSNFSEGLAFIKVNDMWSFIDTNGRVVNFSQEAHSSFCDGLAMFREKDKFGYIDKNGKVVISPRFANAQSFSDGLAAVKNEEKEDWGYIDTTGNVVIWTQFEVCGEFSEGLAPVGRWKLNESSEVCGIVWEGFIDKTGKMVINRQFEGVSGYKNGMALIWNPVGHNGINYSWLDKQGHEVYKFFFPATK